MQKQYSKKYIIDTGIGLQDVDHLQNSAYYSNESDKYIRGEISLDELNDRIRTYYKKKQDVEERTEEADKVAVRISKLISEDAFTFSVGQLLSIHKYLFDGIFENAGKIRTYNFTKNEWALNNESVTYGDYRQLKEILQYDFESEKYFDYKSLSMDEVINHLAVFIANLWQSHVFEEGNTRTTAVFVIKYLRSLGFDVSNDLFAKNAWYFRNALVRANYSNIQKGIYEDRSYLIMFLRNLLLNEKHALANKELLITDKTVLQPDSNEIRIQKLMQQNPHIKLDDIAAELQISVRTVKSIVAVLKQKKRIERIGGKKYGYWKT